MCLMCENYLDICDQPECVADAASGDMLNDPLFVSRSGERLFLWRGYGSSGPCVHMRENHGPECRVVNPGEDGLYDDCSCYLDGQTWVYD